MSRLPGVIKKKVFYVFKLFPFANLAIEKKCNHDFSKIIMARSFKFGPWIQVGKIILNYKLMVGAQCFITQFLANHYKIKCASFI